MTRQGLYNDEREGLKSDDRVKVRGMNNAPVNAATFPQQYHAQSSQCTKGRSQFKGDYFFGVNWSATESSNICQKTTTVLQVGDLNISLLSGISVDSNSPTTYDQCQHTLYMKQIRLK